MDRLVFKWTTSKGRYTYGYNICSLYVNGVESFSTCGGYDMRGTLLGKFMEANYQDELKTLIYSHGSSEFIVGVIYCYGYLSCEEGSRVHLDGSCGFDQMMNIAKAIGYELTFIDADREKDIYVCNKINV